MDVVDRITPTLKLFHQLVDRFRLCLRLRPAVRINADAECWTSLLVAFSAVSTVIVCWHCGTVRRVLLMLLLTWRGDHCSDLSLSPQTVAPQLAILDLSVVVTAGQIRSPGAAG